MLTFQHGSFIITAENTRRYPVIWSISDAGGIWGEFRR